MSRYGFIEADLGYGLRAKYNIKHKVLQLTGELCSETGYEEVDIPVEALNDLIKIIVRIKNYEETRIKLTDEFSEKQKGVKND